MFCKSFKNISFFVVHLSQSISTLFCAPRPNTKNGRVPYPRPPAIHSAFLRQQHPQRKPLILPVQRHSSAALFGCGAHTAQVAAAMGVAARQAVRAQLHFLRAVVFKPQHYKAVLGVHRHPDQPLFVVGLGLYALGRVVQRRTNNRADFPCLQKNPANARPPRRSS